MGVSSYFQQADHNLMVAEKLCEAGHFGWSAFVAGQAGEIAVKGLLNLFHHESIPDLENVYGKSRHRIDRLINLLPVFCKSNFADSMQKETEELSRHFISTRYPTDAEKDPPFSSYAREDAAAAIESARKLVRICADFVTKIEQAIFQK